LPREREEGATDESKTFFLFYLRPLFLPSLCPLVIVSASVRPAVSPLPVRSFNDVCLRCETTRGKRNITSVSKCKLFLESSYISERREYFAIKNRRSL
jgi:hypothetical protein